MHDYINILFCVLFAGFLTAQIDPIRDTLVCDHFVLSDIKGSDLSLNTAYFDQSNGEGNQYESGDTIFSSIQLFAYDPVNEFEECFYIMVFGPEAAIDMPDTLKGCDYLTLPVIRGKALTIHAAYYTKPLGQGVKYFPGNKLKNSQLLYLFDGNEECSVSDTLFANIPMQPELDYQRDTFGCTSFKLPPIKGDFIPGSSYYKSLRDFSIKHETDHIYSWDIFEVNADTANCQARDTFKVRVVDNLYIQSIDDITICGEQSFELESISTSGVNLFVNGRKENPNGRFSLNSGRYCIVDTIPESTCYAKSCFAVYKYNINKIGGEIKDTLKVCNNKTIDLKRLFKLYGIRGSYYIAANPNLPLSGKWLDTRELDTGIYSILLVARNNSVCSRVNDSLIVHLEVVDECTPEDEIVLQGNCYKYYAGNIFKRMIYGGSLYDFKALNNYRNFSEEVPYNSKDTILLHYIFFYQDRANDTVKVWMPPYTEIKPLINNIDSSLCFQETESIPFNIRDGDTVVFSNIKLVETPIDKVLSWNLSLRSGTLNIAHKNFPFIAIFWDTLFITKSGTEYFLEVQNELLGPHETFNYGNYCYKNLESDTIFFSTAENKKSVISGILCPSEKYIVQNDTFGIDRPSGLVKLDQKASNGCDSFVEVNLEFYTDVYTTRKIYFCDSSDYIYLNCERFDIDNPSGRIIYEGSSVSGCDSVVDVELIYQGTEREYREVTICPEASFELNGHQYDAGSTAIDTLENRVSCDSVYVHYNILEIDITDTPALTYRYNCDLQNFELFLNGNYQQVIWPDGSTGDKFQTDDEIINYTIIDTNGCEIKMTQELNYPRWNINGQNVFYAQRDTSFRLNLDTSGLLNELNWIPASNLDCTSCLNPQIHTDTTKWFILNFKDAKGCPQQHIIYVIFPQEEEIDLQMCREDSLFFNGVWYSSPGNFQITAYSHLGHDSVYYDLSVEYYENTPILIEGDSALCPGDTIRLEVVSDHEELKLDGQIVNRVFEIFQPGQYRISGLDMNNCKSSETFTIGSLESPVVKTEDLLDIHYLDGIPLPVEYEGDIINYKWHPAEHLNCEDCPYPVLIDRTNGTFHISIKAQNGCTAENSVIVRFLDTRYYIPNLIPIRANAPENGTFYVRGDFDTRYDLQVYSRWGELVYEDRGLHMNQEEGWKPDVNTPIGVYTYRIVIYDLNEQIVVFGDVTVK